MVVVNLAAPQRRRLRRGKTLSPRRLRHDRQVEAHQQRQADPQQRPKREQEQRELLRILDDERPRTRSECRDGPRPCLFVGCRFHLYLDVNPMTGSIKLNFPDRDLSDLPHSCALDVAERLGGLTLDEVGALLNVTRERARQLEAHALGALWRQLHDE